jgi:multisubunit Na+/H+ antiporter MnhC subunit
MTDALLFVLVLGAIVLALAVDVAAVVGWLRRRGARGGPQ